MPWGENLMPRVVDVEAVEVERCGCVVGLMLRACGRRRIDRGPHHFLSLRLPFLSSPPPFLLPTLLPPLHVPSTVLLVLDGTGGPGTLKYVIYFTTW